MKKDPILFVTSYPDDPGTIAGMLRRLARYAEEEDNPIDWARATIDVCPVEDATSVEEAYDKTLVYKMFSYSDMEVENETSN